MKKSHATELIVQFLSDSNAQILERAMQDMAQSHCLITDSRIVMRDGVISAYFSLQGKWNQIAKLEGLLQKLPAKGLHAYHCCRSEKYPCTSQYWRYHVSVCGIENPNHFHHVMQYFLSQGIAVSSASSQTVIGQLGARLQCMDLIVALDPEMHISHLRDNFFMFCDDHGLDVLLSPEKPI